jgi:ESCRT-II complex subunit VPS25
MSGVCADVVMAEFHGMDPELLQKALSILVKRGKAQVFGQEDQQGVKFF